MRLFLAIVWVLLIPAGATWYLASHERHETLDAAGRSLAEARQLVGEEKWGPAVAAFETALGELPAECVREARELRLEMANAKMNAARLPEAHEELKGLLDELLQAETPDADLIGRVRESMASSQFYVTWLMRLEGLAREEWEPEIESARQNFRLLAEQAESRGDSAAANRQKENLEASIQLARLDLDDLQGLPLPSQ